MKNKLMWWSVRAWLCALVAVSTFALAPAPALAQDPGDDDDEGDLEPPPDYEASDEGETSGGEESPPPPVATPTPPPPANTVVLDGPGPAPSPPARTRPALVSGLRKPSDRYDPHVGFQTLFFVSGHPTDLYTGVSFSAQFHVAQKWSFSLDGRFGGGLDRDDDNYLHSLGTFGLSGYHWFRGDQERRRLQPYVRLGFGGLWLPDEHFDDGSHDDDDDDDWDKKSSRNLKKNGAPAAGHSSSYLEEAAGVRLVLFPRLWYLAVGGTFDLELALVQDNHYGITDSSLKLSLGFTLYF